MIENENQTPILEIEKNHSNRTIPIDPNPLRGDDIAIDYMTPLFYTDYVGA